jgi:hypothetical protein
MKAHVLPQGAPLLFFLSFSLPLSSYLSFFLKSMATIATIATTTIIKNFKSWLGLLLTTSEMDKEDHPLINMVFIFILLS